MKKKFTDYLLDEKIITPEELDRALKIQKENQRSLIEILGQLGYVEEEKLVNILAGYLSIPPIKILNFTIAPDILNLIPQPIALEYRVIPISRIGTMLSVAMVDPLNVLAIDNLKKITGCEINPVIAPLSDIKEAISGYYDKASQTSLEAIVQDQTPDIELIKDSGEEGSGDITAWTVEEAPIIKLTNYLIKQAVEEKASDILIEPLEKVSRVRYRLDGVLKEVKTFPRKYHPFVVSRIKVLANLNISEHRLPQEGRFRKKISNKNVDFRISILPSSLGEKAALRVLDQSTALLDLDLLGFEPEVLEKMKKDSLKPHGLFLVCGPTGSGKTTTLYSIINYIYTPGKNIVTVEDPIEYQIKGINQVSINPFINLTFASVLRSILRQDPDIIMIGEIRDAETADIAIKAALTGHLVLSTLHTTTSAGSIARLLNMGIEPFLLSSTLIGVLTQRLGRRLCPRCKESYPVPEPLEKYFKRKGENIFKTKGCPVCQNTGYKGRVAFCEYLQATPKIKELINTNASENAIKRQARLEEMITLREDGTEKIRTGITTLEEVFRTTVADE